MVAFRIAQPVALGMHDAGMALDHLLADTRHGPVSTISLPGQCLVRMLRRRDRRERLECVVTWEPSATGGCSFLGSIFIMKCGRGTLALVLDGLAEIHDLAQLQDERLGRERVEATGRAVLEMIASELAFRTRRLAAPSRKMAATGVQQLMNTVSPMPHTARAKSAE